MATFKTTNAGNYTGTYSFTSEVDGETEPTGFTNEDTGNGESSIVAKIGQHLKVLQFVATDDVGNNYAQCVHSIGVSKTDGIVEFWVPRNYGSEILGNLICKLQTAGDTLVCGVQRQYNQFKNYDAGTSLEEILYKHVHVAIAFNHSGGAKDVGDGENLADNSYRIYLNDTKYGDYALSNNNDVDEVVFYADHDVPL